MSAQPVPTHVDRLEGGVRSLEAVTTVLFVPANEHLVSTMH